ncbi:hypothetical protein NE237_028868 [Protea cynaroides]|uniref:Uncharacterized protein n=1 Tax=Protea cynaroides TaxID=273540 RepID=A0A9Q0JU89_9MAGN|nr:hypothetical protein NE237_028868 [Protea cynaroides]
MKGQTGLHSPQLNFLFPLQWDHQTSSWQVLGLPKMIEGYMIFYELWENYSVEPCVISNGIIRPLPCYLKNFPSQTSRFSIFRMSLKDKEIVHDREEDKEDKEDKED